MSKRILITGITGQDGSYLADYLVERGYDVHGLQRRTSTGNTDRIDHLLAKDAITLHQGDLSDPLSILNVVQFVQPHVIYNLADQDHVGWSRAHVGYNIDVTAGAVGRLLEMIRIVDKTIRVFQACSATMYREQVGYLEEDSPLSPQSPYACAKACAYHLARMYRLRHGMHVSCGIMFNHDSPRRSPDYLAQQIARQAVEVKLGKREQIELRGPNATVDLGWAPEYVRAMVLIAEAGQPDDYLVGSRVPCTLKDLCSRAFSAASVHPLLRIYEFDDNSSSEGMSVGNCAKIRDRLGWKAQTTGTEVVEKLVKYLLSREETV